MSKDDYLEKSVRDCVEYAMKQNDKTKRRILTGLFMSMNRFANENIITQVLNDKEKQEWFNNEWYNLANDLQQKIDKAIEYIKSNEDYKYYYRFEINAKELLEILGDKENESR